VNAVRVGDVPWFARPRRGGGVGAWLEILAWIRRQHFDAAIDFRGDIRHLAWLALARIPVRLGYGRTGGGFWLTHPVPYRDVHEVERNLDLVRALVPQAVAGPLLPVQVDAEAVRAADALLAEAGGGGDRRPVIFHVTAGYSSKCWEPESMAQAIDLVHECGLGPVLVIGTAAEAQAIAAVVERSRHPPRVVAGRTTLPQLVALLGRARGFVGHDSGPAHLAVASGVPSVLVYSGVNALRSWGPWGGRTQVLHHEVECSPCGLAICNRNHECMRGIAPQAVVAALRELVGSRSGSPS
jgi:heptosyltransferase-2